MIYAIDAIMCVISMGWKDFLMKGFTWRTTNSATAFMMLVGPLFSRSPVFLVLGMTRAFDFKHISLVLEKFFVLKSLFETLLASVRLILKVTLLLGYVLFIFATFGMQLFSWTKWNYGLDANMNYFTFPSAYTTFVKFASGEDWYDTYQACSVGPPKCIAAGSSLQGGHATDCGSAFFSSVFYHIFYILVVLILQHLYVATMVDTYVSTFAVANSTNATAASSASVRKVLPHDPSGSNNNSSSRHHQQEDSSSSSSSSSFSSAITRDPFQLLGFRQENLKNYQHIWSEFDAEALGYLHKKQLLEFLTRLEPPLGLGTHQKMKQQARFFEKKLKVAYVERMNKYHDIEARIAELNYRLRLTQDDPTTDITLPVTMIRFPDLLQVLTSRIVPLECLTVQEKVDEIAIRGYVRRFRRALLIQSTFRMHRVRRRYLKKKKAAAKAGKTLAKYLQSLHRTKSILMVSSMAAQADKTADAGEYEAQSSSSSHMMEALMMSPPSTPSVLSPVAMAMSAKAAEEFVEEKKASVFFPMSSFEARHAGKVPEILMPSSSALDAELTASTTATTTTSATTTPSATRRASQTQERTQDLVGKWVEAIDLQ